VSQLSVPHPSHSVAVILRELIIDAEKRLELMERANAKKLRLP
jgi:hypothetical protein